MERSKGKQYERQPSKKRTSNPLVRFLIALLLCNLALTGRVEMLVAQAADQPYQLEVIINGHPTQLVASFTKLSSGRFAATRQELGELRIAAPGTGEPTEIVPLDSVPGLTYVYDESSQKIVVSITAQSLAHQTLTAYETAKHRPKASTTTGAVLNYGLFSTFDQNTFGQNEMLDGLTASLESRVFGQFGTFENSGIFGSSDFDTLRLQSTWSYSLEDSLITLNAGDLISGGHAWTRPIRMGGFQIRRNFGIRPDLITKPLPALSGTAAVPSTVDVYVNNIKTYSQQIPGGPFTINNIPVISGGGTARIVVRDASGRETVTESPFYSSPALLRQSIVDFSVESGAARLNYGVESNDYDDNFIASSSLRYGYSDDMTLSAYAETGAGLLNAGLGFTSKLGTIGLATFAANASNYDGDAGTQLYAAFETRINQLYFHARVQHAFGNYRDLASLAFQPPDPLETLFPMASIMPPRTLAFASVGMPLPSLGGSINLSFLHRTTYDDDAYNIASVNYSQRIRENINMHASAFKDLSDERNLGVFVGLSVSTGNRSSVTAGIDHDKKGTGATAVYTQNADTKPGSWGWQIRDTEGRTSLRQAALDYNGANVRMRGQISQSEGVIGGNAYVDGAVAMTADGVFLSRRIDDSFAVVDASTPDVEVRHENRVVGRTDSNGKLLVPGLRAYEENKITINPDDMPVTVQLPETRMKAVPRARSAVNIKFQVKNSNTSGLVIVKDVTGRFIDPGFTGHHLATGNEFVVGYDGQIYLEDLSATNEIEITLTERKCRAKFPFTPLKDRQAVIEGVVCK